MISSYIMTHPQDERPFGESNKQINKSSIPLWISKHSLSIEENENSCFYSKKQRGQNKMDCKLCRCTTYYDAQFPEISNKIGMKPPKPCTRLKKSRASDGTITSTFSSKSSFINQKDFELPVNFINYLSKYNSGRYRLLRNKLSGGETVSCSTHRKMVSSLYRSSIKRAPNKRYAVIKENFQQKPLQLFQNALLKSIVDPKYMEIQNKC